MLEDGQVRLVLDEVTDGLPVESTVGLGSGRADGGALARVEHPELDAGPVDRPRHRATQGVDLAYEVPFADTAEGRVAAHLAEGLDALGQQQSLAAHAGGRQGGLGAGMAATHHNDLKA